MKWMGIMGLAIFWLFTLISIHFNGWFTISNHTFSKLGVPGLAESPWIFWIGLLLGGAFIFVYGLWMTKSDKKLQIIGGAYVMLSGVFMGLIAPVHAGIRAHDTLAFLTFMIFYTGSTLFGIGCSSRVLQISQPLIFAAALFALFTKIMPSLGYLELYSIYLIVLSTVLVPIFSKDR
jgi:hypothetical membrane protein